jgi:hypothetical protein
MLKSDLKDKELLARIWKTVMNGGVLGSEKLLTSKATVRFAKEDTTNTLDLVILSHSCWCLRR